MRVLLTLVRRELGGHFKAATGYIVIAAVLLMLGFSLVELIVMLNRDAMDVPVTELFYRSFYFWLIVLLTSPVITMRSFAAEKSSGTYEALMTTPVGDWQVVWAKFIAAFLFYCLTWLPSLGMLWVLRQVTGEPALFEPGIVVCTFLGIVLVGAFFMALGCFTSSITRSQIVAAMLSLSLGIGLWVLGYQSSGTQPETGLAALRSQISLTQHMTDFSRGILDTSHVIFYLTGAAFFLFLTHRVVESRRWK